ncbi:MAG: hypothetical protein JWM64_1854 [Frankiales bacterium]|nr:hypothetical protein [Frankiales bacterium]
MPPLAPAAVLGFGLGAFADGIVLHQVLQWHHLTSSYDPSQRGAVLADGLFHAAAWAVVVGALVWAWRRPSLRSGREVVGAVLVGWGAFHVVDQLLFHLLLQAHHIRPGAHTQLYDWGYTALGVLMALAGSTLVRSSHASSRP